VGKLADFVLLSEDPLTVDPQDLAGLEVRATYKEGVRVYPEPEAP
jgi:predicted amidohydrolase YtcJ